MATSKKTTLTPKKATKPPVVVEKVEKFNAQKEIKVVLERLKSIDDYITRSDNADTKDKQKFEAFMKETTDRLENWIANTQDLSSELSQQKIYFENLNTLTREIGENLEKNRNATITLAVDFGKQKNQTDTSLKALAENQMGNEMAIEAVEDGYKRSASLAIAVAFFATVAAAGSIAVQIYSCYH